jgi:hypothetical protein
MAPDRQINELIIYSNHHNVSLYRMYRIYPNKTKTKYSNKNESREDIKYLNKDLNHKIFSFIMIYFGKKWGRFYEKWGRFGKKYFN